MRLRGISLPLLRCRSAAPSSEGAMAAMVYGQKIPPMMNIGGIRFIYCQYPRELRRKFSTR